VTIAALKKKLASLEQAEEKKKKIAALTAQLKALKGRPKRSKSK
jgi:hypothetical protein